MEISCTQRITLLLPLLCLCVQLSFCQAPPSPGNQRNNRPAGPECICPPDWITMLNQYSYMLSMDIMRPVCNIATQGFVTSCTGPPNQRCGPQSCCCRMMDLSLVQQCLPQATHACVPNRLSNQWRDAFANAVMPVLIG